MTRPVLVLVAAAACGTSPCGTFVRSARARRRRPPCPAARRGFGYQELDPAHGQLVVAHTDDASVLVLAVADGSVLVERTRIPTPRDVAIGDRTIFVTRTPGHLVLIDQATLAEVTRVETGTVPDGDARDPDDRLVGVSAQGAGALSLIADGGRGARTEVPPNAETGNVQDDARAGGSGAPSWSARARRARRGRPGERRDRRADRAAWLRGCAWIAPSIPTTPVRSSRARTTTCSRGSTSTARTRSRRRRRTHRGCRSRDAPRVLPASCKWQRHARAADHGAERYRLTR